MNLKLIEEQNTRNLKDFLTLYNSLTDHCFNRCITRLYSNNLNSEELACAETCAEKYVTFNQRIMQNFIEQQQTRQQALATQMAQSQMQTAQDNQKLVTDTGQKT